jgi:putative ATPase
LQSGKVPSMIFRGPPGCGKTTIAHIISQTLQADFFYLSGVTSKKEDLLKLVDQAKLNFQYGKSTIIFLDEIHRWNKAQQDTLLPYVEKGTVILI